MSLYVVGTAIDLIFGLLAVSNQGISLTLPIGDVDPLRAKEHIEALFSRETGNGEQPRIPKVPSQLLNYFIYFPDMDGCNNTIRPFLPSNRLKRDWLFSNMSCFTNSP